jgi:hypothetical protein
LAGHDIRQVIHRADQMRDAFFQCFLPVHARAALAAPSPIR